MCLEDGEGEWNHQQFSTAFSWKGSLTESTGKRPLDQEGSATRLSFTWQVYRAHWVSLRHHPHALSSSVLDTDSSSLWVLSHFFMRVYTACSAVCNPGHMGVLSSHFSLSPALSLLTQSGGKMKCLGHPYQ